MDRYQRVPVPREAEEHAENEVRITSQGKSRSYISYGTSLLTEKGHSSVVLKAMGKAINKTVTIAEIMKRRIAGLHQNTAISSVELTDHWEPKEEGLDPIDTTRHVSVITITLSKDPLDTSAPGYQPPLPESEARAGCFGSVLLELRVLACFAAESWRTVLGVGCL
ncbi:hypothetical protein COHA_007102 [Chlorella ohadii]|uniref:DNA/RNA-binding protein Alba-like domain-containing protein n=1 Tax=Chlorella ohadii TaxID=2649997 RepID=A0AAD5DK27_9CHLO|nr:hypothetical protein COHA_007102 [Chlorella ohadii]